MKRGLVAMASCLALLAATSAWWLAAEMREPFFGSPVPEVFVEIPKGARTAVIARDLVAAGVLRSEIPFLLYLRWIDGTRRLQAGEYRFAQRATPREVAERLIRGDVHQVSVTIPEGLTAAETVEIIVRQGLGQADELAKALLRTDWIRDLDPQARTLEGYLFPDTYRFARKTDSASILSAMVAQFRKRLAGLLARNALPPGRTIRDITILASLVEKEASTEREMVASVFSNRLARGIPLACDPTVIYALKLAGGYDGNIRKDDLSMNSPYNTYLHAGLPPSPIANPGESALAAALSPATTPFLYFVSRNDGTHFFSKDFRTHDSAVERYQKQRRR